MAQADLTKEELDALAHTLAYEYASSVIDCNCDDVSEEQDEMSGDWFDADDGDSKDDLLADCVRYLEARGLIARHPQNADWISIHDESEATR